MGMERASQSGGIGRSRIAIDLDQQRADGKSSARRVSRSFSRPKGYTLLPLHLEDGFPCGRIPKRLLLPLTSILSGLICATFHPGAMQIRQSSIAHGFYRPLPFSPTPHATFSPVTQYTYRFPATLGGHVRRKGRNLYILRTCPQPQPSYRCFTTFHPYGSARVERNRGRFFRYNIK